MRRILLASSLLLTCAALPATASAHPWLKSVRADIRNDSDQTITLGYNGSDGRYRTFDLAPGAKADDVNRDDAGLTLSLENCGPTRIKIANPTAGAPSVALTADGAAISDADSDSFDEDERHNERFQGVLITTVRQPDTGNWKNFDIAIKTCRAAASSTMTPVDEESPAFATSRFVRAGVRNSTGKTVEVGYGAANDRWKGLRLAPGEASAGIGFNERILTLTLPDCGPIRMKFTNSAVFPPAVSMSGENWVISGRQLDEGESTTFTRDGRKIAVKRVDDSDASKRFEVDLLDCTA
jgi:hypothetical protein